MNPASSSTPQIPAFQQIFSNVLFLKRHKPILLADRRCALPSSSSNGLHPRPSVPAGNTQASLPAGCSNSNRKFFKPNPEVFLIIEIKPLSLQAPSRTAPSRTHRPQGSTTRARTAMKSLPMSRRSGGTSFACEPTDSHHLPSLWVLIPASEVKSSSPFFSSNTSRCLWSHQKHLSGGG